MKMARIKQKDIWEIILQKEKEMKRTGHKINPFTFTDDVIDSIENEPANKIKEIPLDIRHKMRNRFKKRYGW